MDDVAPHINAEVAPAMGACSGDTQSSAEAPPGSVLLVHGSYLMVPGADARGLVAPIICLPVLMASLPSQT